MSSPYHKKTKITNNDAKKTTGNDSKKSPVKKRLQTELQSLIAFAAYNSAAVLQGGTSGSKNMITARLYEAYMPSSLVSDDCITLLDSF